MKITELVGIIGAGLIPIAIFVPVLGVLLGVFPQPEIESIQLLFGIFPFFFGMVFVGLVLFELNFKEDKK